MRGTPVLVDVTLERKYEDRNDIMLPIKLRTGMRERGIPYYTHATRRPKFEAQERPPGAVHLGG